METGHQEVIFYFNDPATNRKKLFEDAISFAKHGKVLYILHEELTELPELSQEITLVSKQYMKMICFLYAKTLESLLESVSTLPHWQNIPSLIILEDLHTYAKNNGHIVCGVVSLLLDAVISCSKALNVPCTLCIAAAIEDIGAKNCDLMRELYCTKQ